MNTTPHLVAKDGPADCSTTMALEAYPSIVWDANAYYATLGVSPRATKRQIRLAYQLKGGQHSERLTFVMHQLLNAEVRAAYDATPIGTLFFDDVVMDWVRAQAAADLAQAREQAAFLNKGEVEVEELKLSDLLNKPYLVDRSNIRRHYGKDAWEWSYYQWDSRCDDTGRLRVWRDALVERLWRRRGSGRPGIRLAVGYYTGPLPWAVARLESGDRIVAFLHEDYREIGFDQVDRAVELIDTNQATISIEYQPIP